PLVGEKTRVSGTGWSTSAAVALAASSALFGFGARAASTVRVAVAFYPICSTTEASELTGSVLFLPGGGDPLTPPDRCVRSVRRRKTRYRRVGRYPGATHAFDLGRDGVLQGMVGNPGFYGGSLA